MDEAFRFLADKASGADKEREQAAVDTLVGMMDLSQRQPTKADDAVMQLVELTNRELAKQR